MCDGCCVGLVLCRRGRWCVWRHVSSRLYILRTHRYVALVPLCPSELLLFKDLPTLESTVEKK